ncbi:hypothetical protein TELCIR_17144 [Teladorsagia circumcincta]|uniref:Uncharacterized protein n=1 Tax=Teladorsagia circumcincta TaxID=45464 RepID=A0A2G9TTK3_TELCI|nr:hypothetical protein TELCIR_17144 [Teladorsagia circumcincta]
MWETGNKLCGRGYSKVHWIDHRSGGTVAPRPSNIDFPSGVARLLSQMYGYKMNFKPRSHDAEAYFRFQDFIVYSFQGRATTT